MTHCDLYGKIETVKESEVVFMGIGDMNYSNLPLGALEDFKSMAECALVRAEVDEDIAKYNKMHDKLEMINAEIERRKENEK